MMDFRHIYQINESLWEVYVNSNMIRDLQNQNEFDFYLDFLRELGVDFVIHNREGIDEYQIALPI
jgi:hypothetical protein